MVRTDNDNRYLLDKIMLRACNLPDKKNITVLDCFGGQGILWKSVKRKTGKDIKIIKIDRKKYDREIYLLGDNIKYLKTINFNNIDVVDLDSYGVPYLQLKEIFKRKIKNKIIFVTFIQSVLGELPHEMLNDIGINKRMVSKAKAVCFKNGYRHFFSYLSRKGINKIQLRQSHDKRKNYLCFYI